jgi:Phage capsid family
VENLNGSTNVPAGQTTCTGIVGPVAVKRNIHGFTDSSNRSLWAYGFNEMGGSVPPRDWLGGGQYVWSNILRAAEGSQQLFFGDWQHLIIMERQDVEILSSNVAGTAFANDWITV